MSLEPVVVGIYHRQLSELLASEGMAAILSGHATRVDYDRFLAAVIRCHLHAGRTFAFVYATAAPRVARRFEPMVAAEIVETGVGSRSSRLLLGELAQAVGLERWLDELEVAAYEVVFREAGARHLYRSLAEQSLAAIARAGAFEFLWRRVGDQIAEALARHRGLGERATAWFGGRDWVGDERLPMMIEGIDDQVAHFRIHPYDARTILDMTFRDNVFLRAYFDELVLGGRKGTVADPAALEERR